jgi:hypothetical protein
MNGPLIISRSIPNIEGLRGSTDILCVGIEILSRPLPEHRKLKIKYLIKLFIM